MSNSYVVAASFANGLINLKVRVDDFTGGEYVEISGHATQSGGAFANFYDIQKVPDQLNYTMTDPSTVANTPSPAGSFNSKIITVSANPIPPQKFEQKQDVTTVLRVAKVWVTVLGGNPSDGSGPGLNGTPEYSPSWTIVRRVADMDGNTKYQEGGA